jgi:tetratricopeptide (TPR) repeat protein
LAAAFLLLAFGDRPAAQAARPAVITFPTLGSAGAQPVFVRGITALHQFEYEEANEAFREAQKIDPGLVMAYWGEAMTYNQTLWRHEDVAAARGALARLSSTAAAGRATIATPKERAFLAAVSTLFGDADLATRHRRYADAMAGLYARYPGDPEVASFYALALLGTASRGLIGHVDAHEGHSQTLAGSEIQTHVAAILNTVLQSHPAHPGALHYLLHDLDDPAHAGLALEAARTFAKIEPESSHALHMPSHIFFQLGMWHDAKSSDGAAFSASSQWVTRKGLGPAMRNYHALSWLQYELLQLGRYREAWDTIGELDPIVKAGGALGLLSDLSSMRARFVIETGRWDSIAGDRTFGNVDELFALGVSAARTGDASLAGMARQALAERAQSEREGDLRPAIAIMEREVAAVIELAAGRRDQAVEILQAAARSELQLPPPFGLPEPIKPAPELLGEVMLQVGRPRDAIEPFDQALRRNANRSSSVLGLARAATALGQMDTARQHYRELLANYDKADADLPLLNEVRAALQSTDGRSSGLAAGVGLIALVALAIATALAATVVAGRFTIRGPAQSRPSRSKPGRPAAPRR